MNLGKTQVVICEEEHGLGRRCAIPEATKDLPATIV